MSGETLTVKGHSRRHGLTDLR